MNYKQVCLVQYHFIILLLIIPPSISYGLIPKPGCPDRCGDVPIQFPFGVGAECSLGELFNIPCNKSLNGTHTPYLSYFDDVQVVEINLSQVRIRFNHVLNSGCYNESGLDPEATDGMGYSFYDTPYVYSDDNWLTTIGCDDLVTTYSMDDATFEGGKETFGGSCATICTDVDNSGGDGFCPDNDSAYPPGRGCCLIPIPKGMTQIDSKLTNIAQVWRRGNKKLFPCSYAFLQEKIGLNQSKFRYPLSYLNNSNEFLEDRWKWKGRTPPVVRLDWRINGAKNCSDARQNLTSYACGDHSDCVNYNASVGGYLCSCKQGFEGNPYLTGHGGCQDIDECDTKPCVSNAKCTNNLGSFTCKCQKGYYGDGRKKGTGCEPSKYMIMFIGVGSGMGFFLLLSVCFLLRKIEQRRKNKLRKQKFFKQNGGLILQQRTDQSTIGETKIFHVEELEKATNNFNESRILGQGGQGIVYKGMLSDGKIVAIKKSKVVDKDQLHQFINEVVILSQINHRNVVKLLGCCLETEVPLLVYEYLPNGTLHDLIHDPRTEFPVTWNMRLKIAADIAGALAYLHSASSMPIFHRDIKSRNILLDEKYVIKVSDFGISRALAVDRTHLTTRVKGTFGYFDPEYFQSNQFTEKSDVYSFGVVLVELLTGQKPILLERGEEERSLVTRFLSSIEDNNVEEIFDPQVSEQGGNEEVSAVVLLARRCLNLLGKMRPTMKEVATDLESLRMSQMPTPIIHESEETRKHEAKSMMISDFEYVWTASDISEVASSEIHPLKSETA